ncbi:MAG: tRNA preQ1(34) S-adenosylmethionine ribosyltransferase-isomerase QueA [Candidatus Zixiibacteriota bacterium]
MATDIALFDYNLPQDLIAQFPTVRRDQSRLLILDRQTGTIQHLRFGDITGFLRRGDALVVNNTRVFKARLWGNRCSGGRIELFLVRPAEPGTEHWEALVSPSRRLKPGEEILFDNRQSVLLSTPLGNGRWRVQFKSVSACRRIIATFGHVPLPHYIGRPDQPTDLRRYQTVFAAKEKTGAVAAPTAGFHFTHPLIQQLKAKGVQVIELTLHVGPGTFKPVKCEHIEDHIVDPEYAEISSQSATAINNIKQQGGSLFVVGTTTVRTLESAATDGGDVRPFAGFVSTYIKPGHNFRLVDHLITNFHLPRSSLLILVSAFAGRERILGCYREAIARGYRFYSYGDAMLIL